MFWKSQQEEEFKFKPKLEQKIVETKTIDTTEIMEKINTLTEQINTISKYLSYLSQKFDRTLEGAVAYDKTLSEIERRINALREKIDELEIVSPDVDLAEDRKKAF
ncbi:MAG: hypothetical protein QXY45_04565 [Candidatus Aenigmatarchaeota archaeon]